MEFIIAAIILGLGGSLHCVGMCGPLIISIPFEQNSGIKKITAIAVYFIAKAFIYAIMGTFFALIGWSLKIIILQQWLSIIAGIFIILLALYPIYFQKKLASLNLFSKLRVSFSINMQQNTIWSYMRRGALNALLPCGLIYTALLAAAATSSVLKGSFFMFIFGITSAIPLIILAVAKTGINVALRQKLRPVTMFLSIIMGILLIIRGLGLGIPYLSPVYGPHGEVISCH